MKSQGRRKTFIKLVEYVLYLTNLHKLTIYWVFGPINVFIFKIGYYYFSHVQCIELLKIGIGGDGGTKEITSFYMILCSTNHSIKRRPILSLQTKIYEYFVNKRRRYLAEILILFIVNPIPAGGRGQFRTLLHITLPLGIKPGFYTNCLIPQTHCLNDYFFLQQTKSLFWPTFRFCC